MKTQPPFYAREDLDTAAYARARGWGAAPESALRAVGCRIVDDAAVALMRDLEADPDVRRRIERERAKCKAADRDAIPYIGQLARIRADNERLLVALEGPDAEMLLDMVADRWGPADIGTSRSERREATRRVLLELMAREWFVCSAPELYQELRDAVVAGRKVSKRLRTQINSRFDTVDADGEAKYIQEMMSRGMHPQGQLDSITRILAHAHEVVVELYGPAAIRRE